MIETEPSIDISRLREQLVNSIDIQHHSQIAPGTSPRECQSSTRRDDSYIQPLNESFASLPATVPETGEHAGTNPVPAAVVEAEIMNSQDENDATQQISQSVHEEIIRRSRSERPSIHSDAPVPPLPNDETQLSVAEGDEGHIDIVSSFAQPQIGPEDDSLAFSLTQTQLPLTQFPESQRFKTPATAGRKRKYNGEPVDTPVQPQNPLLRGGEGTLARVLGLSQVFAATQAASSPFVHGPVSALKSDRPSPNVDVERNQDQDISSPLLNYISNDKSVVKGPQSRYVSIQESQEHRRRRREQNDDTGDEELQQESYDDFDSVPSIVRRKKAQREREERVRAQLKAASSPRRDETSPDRRGARSRKRRKGSGSSESMPSSPPLLAQAGIVNAESSAGIPMGPITSSDRALAKASGGIDAVGSSANPELSTTVIPDTLRRTNASLKDKSNLSQPSPSSRITRTRSIQHVTSVVPPSTATSQVGPYFTQLTTVSEADNTGYDRIDRVSASPEKELEITQQAPHSAATETQDPEAASILPINPHKEEIFGNVHRRTQPTQHLSSAVPETSSHSAPAQVNNAVASQTRDSTVYETAASKLSQRGQIEDDSSQPVRATPPGRKRKARVVEDEDDFGTPVHTQVCAFDAAAALALDPDPVTAALLANTPEPKRVISRRNVRNGVPDDPLQSYVAEAQHSLRNPAPTVPPSDVITNRGVVSVPDAILDNERQEPSPKSPHANGHTLVRTAQLPQTPSRPARPSIYDIMSSPEDAQRPLGVLTSRTQPVGSKSNIKPIKHIQTRKSGSTPTTNVSTMLSNKAPQLDMDSPDPLAMSMSVEPPSSPAAGSGEVVAPNMVFACYFGKTRAYYPAERLDVSADGSRHTIQWFGYDPESIDKFGVCALDLRLGDTVKIDAKGFGKTPYLIKDFKTVPTTSKSFMITDIYGHSHITVIPKLRTVVLGKRQPSKSQEVPIADIYLDSNMWPKFRNRNLMYKSIVRGMDRTGTSTPSLRPSTPSTPSSRYRAPFQESSIQPSNVPGIFAKMAFVLSLEEAQARETITALIKAHGGTIFTNSFRELLDDDMSLRPDLQQLGFVALVSDRHSRKEKYMQALALGLPCLSKRWIELSTKHNRLPDWQDYLLPAGESIELDGAIRSRRLPDYAAESVRLTDTLVHRHNLFANSYCVFTTGTKKTEARRKTHLGLARMMGATHLDLVTDLAKAEEMIRNAQHDKIWLLVDDKEGSAARNMVQDLKVKQQKARRKTGQSKTVNTAMETDPAIVIMDAESIMQSLILGRYCSSFE